MREPTNLIALWAGRQAPRVDDVRKALGERADFVVTPRAEGDDVLWTAYIHRPHEQPIVMWAEVAREIPETDLNDPRARACRWAVGAEQVLDPGDPLTSWLDLGRCLLGVVPEAPAMIDVNTATWHGREALNALFAPRSIEPPAEVLWTIHAVEAPARSTVWLHTHGLWRCGRPELEMLEVPSAQSADAAQLMNDLATMLLEEQDAPRSGQTIEIGPGLRVTLQPWREVAAQVPDAAPGSMGDRTGEAEEAHSGERLVICGQRRRGGPPAAWTWPQEVLDALASGQGTVYRTARASARQAEVARATWNIFLSACGAEHGAAGLVKVQYDDARGGDHHEHLWFAVVGVEGGVVRGELLNDPLISGLERGAAYDLDAARVSDWRVSIDDVQYAPDDSPALSRALGRVLSARGSSR